MNRLFKIRRIVYLSALVCVALALFSSYQITKASDEAGNALVWIPFVDNGRTETGGENPPPPPPPPPPGKEPWAFFTDTQFKTASASIAIDAKGGMHLGYLYYEPINDDAPTTGVYLYCASQCEKPENWNGVSMGDQVSEIQVALTAAGAPRVLFRAAAATTGSDYYYAECDQKCTDPTQWSLSEGAVATQRGTAPTELGADELPQRYFALDPQGRPRFVYSDSDSFREPDHYGNFYVYCNSKCTDPSNWFDTQINKDSGNQGPYRSERYSYPSLTFNKDGQPFVLAEGTSMQDDSYLFYVTCEGNCESREGWTSVPLYSRGSGLNISVDVEVDAQGRPRFAYYEGAQLEGKGDVLWYGWCDGGCADAGNWQRYEVGLPRNEGQSPDLELDSTGKPHIAYALYGAGGLGYSSCSADCESPNGVWQHQVVESGSQLEAAWDVAFPPHCDGGIWDGLTPVLDFDQGGNPIFAYDATYNARCWYDDVNDSWEPQPYFHLIQRSVRTFFLPNE